MAARRVLFRHIGSTGLAVQQVENASASGAFAFADACLEVASGRVDVSLAPGVDKHGDQKRAVAKEGINRLSDAAHIPLARSALLCRTLKRESGLTAEDLAGVGDKAFCAGADIKEWDGRQITAFDYFVAQQHTHDLFAGSRPSSVR